MTYLVERLAELRRHVAHLREIAARVPDRQALESDIAAFRRQTVEAVPAHLAKS